MSVLVCDQPVAEQFQKPKFKRIPVVEKVRISGTPLRMTMVDKLEDLCELTDAECEKKCPDKLSNELFGERIFHRKDVKEVRGKDQRESVHAQ